MARQWKVLLVVSTAVFVASLDLFIVNVAFPDIAADFDGTELSELSWVLNAYTIVFAALLVPAGRMADRTGRKRAFLIGLLLFVTASALASAAPSVEALVAARIIQAAGAAVLLPTSLALLLPEFSPAQRPVAIGIWAAVGGVAAAAGPPLGGLLVELSWRWVFIVNLPVGLVTAVVAARLLREIRDETQRSPDWVGTVLLVAGVGTLALGLVRSEDWGFGDVRTLAALAGAAVAVALFLARSARHPAPVVDLAMLRVRAYAAANAASLLFFVAFSAMLLGSVLFLTQVWERDVLEAGLSIAPGPSMAALFAVPAGRLGARFGPAPVSALGAILFAAGGAWWIARVGTQPDYVADFLPGMLVGGIGVGLVLPTMAAAAAASLPPERFATGTAVFQMSRQLGSVLGVALLVAVIGQPAPDEALDAFQGGWALLVGASLAAAAAAFAIGPMTAPGAEPEAALAQAQAA